MRHVSKLIQPKQVVMRTSIYRWPSRSTDFNLYLWLTFEECEWVGVGESLGFKPSIYVIWYYFQRTSGRVEINYRISRWYSQRKTCYLVWDSYIPFEGNFIKRKTWHLWHFWKGTIHKKQKACQEDLGTHEKQEEQGDGSKQLNWRDEIRRLF